MKYVFFGTPEFARIVLAHLLESGMPPVAVVCNPDRPVGRKQLITPPPVKSCILEHGARGTERQGTIAILQPERLDASFMLHVSCLKPDFFVVAAYAKILPQRLLNIVRLGTIGVHPSLLPKYRGASPIQSTILEGEKTTGVTLYLIDSQVDHGPVLARQELAGCDMDAVTYHLLMPALAKLGGDLLSQTIPKFTAGSIIPMSQNESAATFTKKFRTEDGYVPNELLTEAQHGTGNALEIYRKIRALNPDPGAYTVDTQGRRIKLLEAELTGGRLVLTTIQKEGKTPTRAR